MTRLGRIGWLVSVILAVLCASRAARATNIFLEAEGALIGDLDNNNRITSPLLIKDDDLASDGSYIEVIPGNDSKTSMPAAEGVATLVFDNPGTSATFTIWARVIAPTDGDDSFWVKMDGGSPIKWNGIPLGSSWHWVQVKADGSSTPSQFTLATGTHTLKIAYREDGTKLDALIVSDDASFNPNATLTGPPATPIVNPNFTAVSAAGILFTWQEVPGASSYTLTDGSGKVIGSGLHGHTRSQPTSGCFSVIAVGSAGSSAGSPTECISSGGFIQRKDAVNTMSATPPMKIMTGGGLGTQAGTAESLTTVPAHGRGRYDFRIVGPTQIQVWASLSAPNRDNDSFWVHMDQGPWIKWNNIPNFTCTPVSNSDAGSTPVTFSLTSGSHFVEFAYREIDPVLVTLAPTEPTTTAPCFD